jgi:glyoxylase-like metal-dependent hydrolase (beta-lactamase superfamily II)
VGDIVSKARASTSLTAEEAARVAGVSLADYEQFEDSGKVPAGTNFPALGASVGVNGERVAAIARGWLPRAVDTGAWREFRQITTAGPSFRVHCYLAWDEVTREAALFDTGFEAGPVLALIDSNRLQLSHLFITHTHADHVAAIEPIRARFPKARLHSQAKGAPVEQRNRPNEFIQLGSLRVTHRDTPGHAEDGVTYIIGNWPDDAPHVAVVGDAIFAGSMGGARQLLPLARQKVREQILSLPPSTLICPGHGPMTTVGEESANNPFFA